MGKFIIRQSRNGPMFNLKARNGQIIGTSEVYTCITACRSAIEGVRKAAAAAKVEDQTRMGWETVTHPKFEIYKDKKGEFRFRLKAKNGEIILVSEGYVAKDSCRKGIASIIANAPEAEVIEDAQ